MKKFTVVISNGKDTDKFALKAKSKTDAEQTARIAHIGTAWCVKNVYEKRTK